MLKLKLICRYIFYPLCLKSHALVIAVYADAKVIWSVGMMEADVSPIANEWADALLQEVGCQVSALIMWWDRLREDGGHQEGGCLVSVPQVHSAAFAFTARQSPKNLSIESSVGLMTPDPNMHKPTKQRNPPKQPTTLCITVTIMNFLLFFF